MAEGLYKNLQVAGRKTYDAGNAAGKLPV